MGTKYTTQTQTGFDASPPPNDGSVQASNKVRWDFVKDKIGTPVLNLAQAINTALVTFTNFGSRAVSSTDSVAAADHMKTIEASGTYTESLPDATATGAGFITSVKNVGTGVVTVALVTGTDTLNGVVGGTLTLNPQASVQLKTNAAATGYYAFAFSTGINPENKRAAVGVSTAWDPSDVAGTATAYSGSTITASSTAVDYVTMALASGVWTFTCVKAGSYRFTVEMENESAADAAYIQLFATLGGTATPLKTATTVLLMRGAASQAGLASGATGVFYAVMTAGQTVTIAPKVSVSSAGVTTNFTTQATVSAEYTGSA